MKLRIYKVTGDSMSPAFFNDDYVIAINRRNAKYKIDDVLVLDHQEYGIIIKRVKEITKEKVLLTGDNPASVNETQIGWQSKNNILGKVIFKIAALKKQAQVEY